MYKEGYSTSKCTNQTVHIMFNLALYAAVLIGAIQVLGQDEVDIGRPSALFTPQFVNLEQGSLLLMSL